MKKIVHISGKRKTAVARATLKEGKGLIRINRKPLNIYGSELARLRIQEPLLIAGDIVNKVNIDVNVKGGGWQSQSEASRLAIARALMEFSGNKQLKKDFLDYDRNLVVADVRRRESRKPNNSKGARAKRQKSYR
ncbi:30S ribosomal protein S9 [archaeon]|nr:30S ribosomal protein S9 [archaeon]|tara:strand:+ start:4398 stop:4802 length:405 start_codon:yes stop_codon:yes gene_type:complete